MYLETERLYIREWVKRDIETLAKINSSPLVMEFFQSVMTHDDTYNFVNEIINHFKKHGFGLYALELKDTYELIGFCGLKEIEIFIPSLSDAPKPVFEIQWRVSHNVWGKGYAPEAAKCLLHAAFNEFNLEQVIAFTSKLNQKSIRVMEKIGMTHDERDDFIMPFGNEDIKPHALFKMTSSQYLIGLGEQWNSQST
tara:strand:+ start:143 stop:730 length:588 start_codon:yes stop_codon:yes gene_type:complete